MSRMSRMLQLTVTARAGKPHVRFLQKRLPQAAKMLRAPLSELSIILVGDRRMSLLHERFMNEPGPTDVLTFPIDLDARGRPLSGEVYVCVTEARRQGKALGTPLAHEILLYALHGMLHLCGFDDRTEVEHRRMHRIEDRLLTRLGIGPVYRRTKQGRKVTRLNRRSSISSTP